MKQVGLGSPHSQLGHTFHIHTLTPCGVLHLEATLGSWGAPEAGGDQPPTFTPQPGPPNSMLVPATLAFPSVFFCSSELCSYVPASPWAASFLAEEVKAEVQGMFRLSWSPRISMYEFTGDCKNHPVGPGEVHIRSGHSGVWACLGALGNRLGGSFNEE